MHSKYWLSIISILILFIALSCAKESTDTKQPFIGFEKPLHFPDPVYNFNNNSITKAGFELGRKLFYEPLLSGSNTISCGSCHIQTAAFTHHGHSVSHGIYDRLGVRNSPPIMNLAWSKTFMWDGGVFDLDLQPIVPITNHVEMDDSLLHVLSKLRNTSTYPALFKNAFGSEEINATRFLKAMSQFMVMCVSSHSKYDSVILHQSSFTISEQAGYSLFKINCSRCHLEPLFTNNSFKNNGLSISSVNDVGRYAITLNPADRYLFKVPTLRNVAYTAPCMHDGRLLTLEAVLDHYTSGVQPIQNVDTSLLKNGQPQIVLNAAEKAQIVSFLLTLTDRSFVTDKRFSEP